MRLIFCYGKFQTFLKFIFLPKLSFQIEANDEECFYDRVKSGTKMGLIFEVAEGGALDIDVKIEGDYY